ncbi:MAG: hypothetical protein Q4A27_01530 [bacterium]|nr:hypothetical protein [bacterium]
MENNQSNQKIEVPNPGKPIIKEKSSSNKTLFIVLGCLFGFILIAGIIAVILLFNSVSKQDYLELSQKVDDINSSLNTSLNTTNLNTMAEQIGDAQVKIDKIMAEAKNSKALKDKEVEAAYKKAEDEWDKISPTWAAAADDLVSLQDVRDKCQEADYTKLQDMITGSASAGDFRKAYNQQLGDCLTHLEKVEKSSIKPIAEMGKRLKKYVNEIGDYLAQIAQLLADRNYSASLPDEPEQPDFYDLRDELEKIGDGSDFQEKIHDLQTILNKKF